VLGHDLYEATSNGLTFSLAEDGQYFQTFLFPETFNVINSMKLLIFS